MGLIYGVCPVEERDACYAVNDGRGLQFPNLNKVPCRAYRHGFIQLVENEGKDVWLYCDLPNQKHAIRVLYSGLHLNHRKVGDRLKEGDIVGLTREGLYFEIRELPSDKPIKAHFYMDAKEER